MRQKQDKINNLTQKIMISGRKTGKSWKSGKLCFLSEIIFPLLFALTPQKRKISSIWTDLFTKVTRPFQGNSTVSILRKHWSLLCTSGKIAIFSLILRWKQTISWRKLFNLASLLCSAHELWTFRPESVFVSTIATCVSETTTALTEAL